MCITTTAGVSSFALATKPEFKLANKSAVKACANLAKAMTLAEGAECAKSVLIAELDSYIKSGAITEFNNIVELCAEYFDIGKAQTYNYIKASQFMVTEFLHECDSNGKPKVDKNGKPVGKLIYRDKWGKGFSTTALLAFAYFIKSTPIGMDEDAPTRARRNFVEESIVKGKITSNMSVSKIKAYLNAESKDIIENTGKPAEGAGKPAEGKPAGKPAEGAEIDGIEITLNDKAVKALSVIFKSVDIKAYPDLTELVHKISQYMTTPQSKAQGKAQGKPAEGAEG